MEAPYLLLLLPPAMALVWAYFVARAARRSTAELDAAIAAFRRRQPNPAE